MEFSDSSNSSIDLSTSASSSASSSYDSEFGRAKQVVPIDTSIESSPPILDQRSKFRMIVLVVFVFVCLLCFCFVILFLFLMATGIGHGGGMDVGEVHRSEGMKKMKLNHFIFRPNSVNVLKHESVDVILDEKTDLSVSRIAEDEWDYFSEDEVEMVCTFWCVCRGTEERRQLSGQAMIQLSVIVVGLFVFNNYLNRFNKSCKDESTCEAEKKVSNYFHGPKNATVTESVVDVQDVECVPKDLPEEVSEKQLENSQSVENESVE